MVGSFLRGKPKIGVSISKKLHTILKDICKNAEYAYTALISTVKFFWANQTRNYEKTHDETIIFS